jgi:hypothetical protein
LRLFLRDHRLFPGAVGGWAKGGQQGRLISVEIVAGISG